MKVIRNIVKDLTRHLVSYIEEGGQGGAPSSATDIEAHMRNALAGDTIDVDIPDPESFVKQQSGQSGSQSGADDGSAGNSGQQNNDDFNTSDAWAWKKLESKLSTEENPWSIPNEIKTGKRGDVEITEDERFDLLINTVKEKFAPQSQMTSDDDEFIQEYKIAKQDENFKRENFIQAQIQRENLFKLDDKTFYQAYLSSQKKEDGTPKFSEQDIADHIGKMNAIELEERSSGLKDKLKAQIELNRQNKLKEISDKQAKSLEDWNKSRMSSIEKTIEQAKQLKTLAGFELSESEIENFKPVFDHMTSLNPQTGQQRMYDYLQSNDLNVMKMLFVMNKIDSGEMEKHFSTMKEEVKAKILNKTGVKPNLQSMGGSPGTTMVPPKSEQFH